MTAGRGRALADERAGQGLPPDHIEDEGVLARVAALVMSITNDGRPTDRTPVNDSGDHSSHVCKSE
jgi:hypothetical protein